MKVDNAASATLLALAIVCGLVAISGPRGCESKQDARSFEKAGSHIQVACPRFSLV